MAKETQGSVLIRSLGYSDVARIHEIDRVVTMDSTPRSEVDLWSLIGESTTSFGAEIGGQLAGFVLADVRPWEFGAREAVGWILAIGVHPESQHHGVGKLLGDRVLAEFRRLGVRHASTLVGNDDKTLRSFFQGLGFAPQPQFVLGLRL
ncbi:MAG: GNAT family N-acetyltransferase [Thermoplasmatota archaeon]